MIVTLLPQITTGAYLEGGVVSTYALTGITRDSGGNYKCTFSFANGPDIFKTTALEVNCECIKIINALARAPKFNKTSREGIYTKYTNPGDPLEKVP